MNRVFSAVAACLLAMSVCGANAQSYSTDATLVNMSSSTATVRSSGIASKKKDATEMAVKSAIYTYLFHGIEGLNDGLPLLGKSPSDKAKEYGMNILNGGRYSVFCKSNSVVLDEAASKNFNKNWQVVVNVEIYYKSLLNDLKNNNVIGGSGFSDGGAGYRSGADAPPALPTIMVVPYCSDGDTFLGVIQKNPDVRIAMAKVREGFISRGVETKDFEQALRNANTSQARQGDMSLDDVIINTSGADVMVSVDVSRDETAAGTRISMIVRAVEVANSKSLAEKSETSGRKNASAEAICGALANVMIDDFLGQISRAMDAKIQKGNSVSLRFTIDPNCPMDMDSEVGSQMIPLSDEIIQWVRKNAKNGKYHQQGRSNTYLALDEIQIANKAASGEDMDVNDFSLELYKYFRSLNLNIKRHVVGNTIEVTIQ